MAVDIGSSEILLKYINKMKTRCKFNGVDFEADLSTMYTEIPRCMAVDFPEDFGPEIVQPGKELQDMNSKEYELPPKYFACLPFWLFSTERLQSCLPQSQSQ